MPPSRWFTPSPAQVDIDELIAQKAFGRWIYTPPTANPPHTTVLPQDPDGSLFLRVSSLCSCFHPQPFP